MFHTNSQSGISNGLWQCHTILHIDITRNHSRKVFRLETFSADTKYKIKLDLQNFQSKAIGKRETFTLFSP